MKNWGKYIFVLLLTVGIFAVSWYVSLSFNQRKISELRTIQDKVATDLLSSETQFDLLEEMSCQDIGSSSFLSQEIGALADKLSYSEQNVGAEDQITVLKKQYSILEVKDFLLSKRIGERCGHPPTTIFYFYSSKDACEDCAKQGYVLDSLRQTYPTVRIYSFDYNLDLSTIRALKSLYKVEEHLPALVINGKTVSGFKSVEEVTALLPKDVTNPTPTKVPEKATVKKVQ